MSLYLQPITLREAKAFIAQHHRHHQPMKGWKFGIGVNDGERVVGVAVVGRPGSRIIQDREPYTAEVTRCCTDGTRNACSILYAACWRAARAMGYRRLITYIGKEEAGMSLKASGWKEVTLYVTKGGSWNRPSRPRVDTHPTGKKTLWEMMA